MDENLQKLLDTHEKLDEIWLSWTRHIITLLGIPDHTLDDDYNSDNDTSTGSVLNPLFGEIHSLPSQMFDYDTFNQNDFPKKKPLMLQLMLNCLNINSMSS
jgi:hypothetical protein